MLGIGGADEEVVGDAELRHQRLEALGVAVGQLLGLDPLGLGGVGHRLAVLVGTGEEEHVVVALAHVARDHVGGDRLVRVAEVRHAVDVGDGGGDVERHGQVARLSTASAVLTFGYDNADDPRLSTTTSPGAGRRPAPPPRSSTSPTRPPARSWRASRCPGAADLDAAVRAARAALPEWRAVSTIGRARKLFELRERLVARSEDLARSVTTEMGKTIADARAEVGRMIEMVEAACAVPTTMQGRILEDVSAQHRRRDGPPAGRGVRGDRPVQLPGDGAVLVLCRSPSPAATRSCSSPPSRCR